jgi:hypothetical protein
VLTVTSVNTTAGFPIEVSNITLNNTVLTGLNQDGSVTEMVATVRASFTLLREPSFVLAYPESVDCDSAADTIATRASGADFNLCIPQNDSVNGFFYRSTMDFGSGDVGLFLSSDAGDSVSVNLHDDALVEVLVSLGSTGEQFRCSTDCSGVSVSAADGTGQRTVSFAGAVLHRVQSFPLPGDRSLVLSSGDLSIPPP